MILPLVQDMLNMSAQSLRTRFPQKFGYIKVIAEEKWEHIKIEETKLSKKIKGFRQLIGTSETYWLITINSSLSEQEKYLTLIHELMHCAIDEAKLLTIDESETVVKNIEMKLSREIKK